MNLRTELSITKSARSIDLTNPVITLGSCFAASIGKRLADNKFQVMANPFGTTYHPFAIHRLLSSTAQQQMPPPETFVRRDENWYCYDLHSSFTAENISNLEELIRKQVASTHAFLLQAKHVILTYGTAFVYELSNKGRFVANCHKQPAEQFKRRLASPDEISESFHHMAKALRTLNPELMFILTVSPVRHTRDSLQLNSVSKAALRLACHSIQQNDPLTEYFPSYELLMDDLRDYRFYQNDLVHPTPLAEDYIWKKFSETYCSTKTMKFLEQWQSIRNALSHRPFSPHSKDHQEFLQRTIEALDLVGSQVDVSAEIAQLKAQQISQPVS